MRSINKKKPIDLLFWFTEFYLNLFFELCTKNWSILSIFTGFTKSVANDFWGQINFWNLLPRPGSVTQKTTTSTLIFLRQARCRLPKPNSPSPPQSSSQATNPGLSIMLKILLDVIDYLIRLSRKTLLILAFGRKEFRYWMEYITKLSLHVLSCARDNRLSDVTEIPALQYFHSLALWTI
jgi:hypothetical protein